MRVVFRALSVLVLAVGVLLLGRLSTSHADVPRADHSGGVKVLVDGADPTFRPISFQNASGQLVGFDVDFAKAIAKKMGIKLNYQGVNWDGIIPSLDAGKINTITDMNITPARQQQVNFTRPYFNQYITTVVLASRKGFNPGLSDLKCLKLGVQSSTSASALLATIPGLNVTQYNTVVDEYNDLVLGRLDAVVVESVNGGYTVTHQYKSKLRMTNKVLNSTPVLSAAVVKKGNTKLLKAENWAISQIEKDGTLTKIVKKWFGNLKYKPPTQS